MKRRVVMSFVGIVCLGGMISCTGKSGAGQKKIVTLVDQGVITETKNNTPLALVSSKDYIWVNGVKYRIDGANIRICGAEKRSREELRPGMVVRVRGYLNSDSYGGHATEVEF